MHSMKSELFLLLSLILLNNSFLAAQAPSNDLCQNATTLSFFPISIADTVEGATSQDFDVTTCSIGTDDVGMWYSMTANESNIYQVSLQYSNNGYNSAKLAVFRGGCDLLSCVDNSEGNSMELHLEANAKEEYLFFIGSKKYREKNFVFSVVPIERPPNDDCNTAIEIPSQLPFSMSISLAGSFADFDFDICSLPGYSRGVWYRYTPQSNKIITAKVSSSEATKQIVIFRGSCELNGCFANTKGGRGASEVSWRGIAGEEYSILVTSTQRNSFGKDSFRLEISDMQRPNNDSCESALSISTNNFIAEGDTSAAFSVQQASLCSVTKGSRGIWYSFVGRGGEATVELTKRFDKALYNSRLSLFSGDNCSVLYCIESVIINKNEVAIGERGMIIFNTQEGKQYFLYVTGADGFDDVGLYHLSINENVLSAPSSSATNPPNEMIVDDIGAAPNCGKESIEFLTCLANNLQECQNCISKISAKGQLVTPSPLLSPPIRTPIVIGGEKYAEIIPPPTTAPSAIYLNNFESGDIMDNICSEMKEELNNCDCDACKAEKVAVFECQCDNDTSGSQSILSFWIGFAIILIALSMI